MNLSFIPRLGKVKLLEQAGLTETARIDLNKYVFCYGHTLEVLTEQVQDFFTASQVHYRRLDYMNAIAECLGLDLQRSEHRDTLWRAVVDALNVRRKDGIAWKLGQADMPLDDLRRYAAQLRLSRPDFKAPPLTDMLAPIRLGIARTITYIRVKPPRDGKSTFPDVDDMPGELAQCWKELRRHPCYRHSRPPDLNQHALDTVADRFKDRLWLEPHKIGQLMLGIENAADDATMMFWYWPFTIFKHATRCKIISRNRKIKNPHAEIWNRNQPGFSELWGI